MNPKSIELTIVKIGKDKITMYNFDDGYHYTADAKHFAGYDISINTNIQVNASLLTKVPVE